MNEPSWASVVVSCDFPSGWRRSLPALILSFFLLAVLSGRGYCKSAPLGISRGDIRVRADDKVLEVELHLGRICRYSHAVLDKKALIFFFPGIKPSFPRLKYKFDSVLAYSVTLLRRRRGLKLVLNTKASLPADFVQLEAGYRKGGIFRVKLVNRLASLSFRKSLSGGRKVVVLDPGHGGIDPGNVGGGVAEKKVTFAVASVLRKLFEKAGYACYLTRYGDVYVPLEDRVRLSHLYGADVFVSIHCNSFASDSRVRGFEVFHLSEKGYGNLACRLNETCKPLSWLKTESMRLALALVRSLREKTPLKCRGSRSDELVVLHNGRTPAVLVEMGYLTNPGDRRLLVSGEGRRIMAQAIFEGVVSYLEGGEKYRCYSVRRGDSISSIACRFGVSPGDLLALNPGAGRTLREGTLLRIPSRPRRRVGRRTTGRAPRGLPPGWRRYRVRRGDSLSVIARRFGVSMKSIMAANPSIRTADRIVAGSLLRIPACRRNGGGRSGGGRGREGHRERSVDIASDELYLPAAGSSAGTMVGVASD